MSEHRYLHGEHLWWLDGCPEPTVSLAVQSMSVASGELSASTSVPDTTRPMESGSIPAPEATGHPVILGNAADVVGQLAAFDLVVTDPPYAMGGVDGEWRLTAEVAIALRDAAKLVRKRDGAMVVLAASSGRSVEFMSSAVGLPLKRILTWHRPDARSVARSGWRFDTVLALVFGKVPAEGGSSSHISAASPKTSGHKAEVPDEVADWLLAPFGDRVRIVLDPFCGSGSLLAAAQRAGHSVLGIDVDERWADFARERLAPHV